ncbi:hypothetical protein FRB97_005364 [Tulasnella sp. 331]|nr:hypothetical protein FRB97_005364 [Tulasnella sp. 331]
MSTTSKPRIVLYSSDPCPWSHRTRIALKAAGAEHEIFEIHLPVKPEWYPKVNPAGKSISNLSIKNLKVPALSYGAPIDSDVSDPPAGTFILAESALIVHFVASLFPQIDYKDLVVRAKASFVQLQFENLVAPHWGKLQRSGGHVEDFDALVQGLKTWSLSLPEEILGTEYGVTDTLLAPFVTRLFIMSEADIGAWAPGTGPKLISAISGPEYANLHRLAKKLRDWNAVKETVNQEALMQRFSTLFKKAWEENYAGKTDVKVVS